MVGKWGQVRSQLCSKLVPFAAVIPVVVATAIILTVVAAVFLVVIADFHVVAAAVFRAVADTIIPAVVFALPKVTHPSFAEVTYIC